MASVTATATMAAAGCFDKRSSTSSTFLQTPGSGSFPSEMLSPMAASPGFMRREDALKTPITPPSAYLDFLRNMSPAIVSPAASATSARFSFNDKSFDNFNLKSATLPPHSATYPPTSQPALSRNSSYESSSTTSSEQSQLARINAASARATRPESPRLIIPPSPFIKPGPRSGSASTPHLRIPQSPLSANVKSATPLSATSFNATFSPGAEGAGPAARVSVRHVVTRTVTYCRTPLEPAPKGKRRKLERSDTIKEDSEEPPLKQEKIEELDESSASSPSQSSEAASS